LDLVQNIRQALLKMQAKRLVRIDELMEGLMTETNRYFRVQTILPGED